MLKLSNPMIIN